MQPEYFYNNVSVQWGGYGQGMGPGMMNWGYGVGWFMGIVNIVFWVAVIVGVIYLIKWLAASSRQGGNQAKTEDSAMEILRKRYAAGEISQEEFEEKKKDLER